MATKVTLDFLNKHLRWKARDLAQVSDHFQGKKGVIDLEWK
jgi:hypothetical protein